MKMRQPVAAQRDLWRVRRLMNRLLAEQAANAPPIFAPSPSSVEIPQIERRPAHRWHAARVKDVPLPNDFVPSSLAASGGVLKIWTLRNSGLDAWPPGTLLIHIRGDIVPLAGILAGTAVPLAKPGETVDVAVLLRVPADGSSSGSFRLMDPSGRRFGPTLSVSWPQSPRLLKRAKAAELKVAPIISPPAPPPPPSVAVAPPVCIIQPPLPGPASNAPVGSAILPLKSAKRPPSPPLEDVIPANFPYRKALHDLRTMGFKDVEVNMQLLTNFGGDLMRTCNWLLTNLPASE